MSRTVNHIQDAVAMKMASVKDKTDDEEVS